ncbi:MAG: hypothetical protein HYX63_01720 [Gammaproteobacteria bacterium]|nr:hypothetical protein [Gammaproteobacteria bacterium]
MATEKKDENKKRASGSGTQKRGRPQTYTDADIATLLERMGSEGKALLTLCKEAHIAYSTARKRINESNELSAVYAVAIEEYAHTRVQLLDEIALGAKTAVDVQRAKLRCDNIKWEVAKVIPRVYGDRLQNDPSSGLAITIHEAFE